MRGLYLLASHLDSSTLAILYEVFGARITDSNQLFLKSIEKESQTQPLSFSL